MEISEQGKVKETKVSVAVEEQKDEKSPVEKIADEAYAKDTKRRSSSKTTEQPVVETVAEDTDKEYTDERSFTVSIIKNFSLYRKANSKVLPKQQLYIGSCYKSSTILCSNKEEIEAYFPNIIGIAPNNPEFITRVKAYINNIRIPVDELGKTFDNSFHYYHKSDYYRFKRMEDAIDAEYNAVSKTDISALRKAMNVRITKLNSLETEKCRYGYPVNVVDYLMYRHCMLFDDIAKDDAFINSDTRIRFYIKDDQKEAKILRKNRVELNKAKGNYVRCIADDSLFDAVYIQFCIYKSMPVLSSMAEDKLERETKLDKFSSEEPYKFNEICSNKDVMTIALIENLIAHNELVRNQYSQNITTSEGELIGANMKEALVFFKNPANSSIVEAYRNKLKFI